MIVVEVMATERQAVFRRTHRAAHMGGDIEALPFRALLSDRSQA
jgi:hypothetical protein